MRTAARITLSAAERAALVLRADAQARAPRLAQRAQMVLLAADGLQNQAIAEQLGVGRVQVARWRGRYAQLGLAGIEQDGAPAMPQPAARVAPPATGRLAAAARACAPALAEAQAPRGARQLMPRDALLARLVDARRQRCVVVQGQAGSGKTSTLLAWRRALLSLDFDVAWLSLGPEDNSLTRFCDGLLASVAAVAPASVAAARVLTGCDSSASAIEHWVIALVQGIAQHPRPLVLMLDDVHGIEDAAIVQALQWLLDYAPAPLHLAFSTRRALPLSLERLRLQGTLTALDMRDLRFSVEETACYLREQLGTAIAPQQAEALHRLTNGWVAGLQLFALDMRAKDSLDVARVQVCDTPSFAAYVEREVLARLAPDELDLLTRMAACQRFSAALCAAVLDQPAELVRLRGHLMQLDNDNFFLTQVGGPDADAWYRLHPLLRETLLVRLAQWPAEAQRALHARAWAWLAARGQVEDAVQHAVLAGDQQAAATMVQERVGELQARGDLSQLARLLRKLPTEQVHARFELLLASAYVQLYTRNFAALRHSIAQLQAQGEGLAPLQRYEIVLLRGGLAVQQADLDAVVALVPQLQAIPADAADLAWSGCANILSWMHLRRGEYAHARRVVDDCSRHSGAPRGRLLGQCIQAASLSMQGELREAERLVRQVLQETEQHGADYAGLTVMAAAMLAGLLLELGDAEAARQLLEPRIPLLLGISLPGTVEHALQVLADAHWLAGRQREAHACIDRLQDYAEQYALDRLLARALLMRLRRDLQQGAMERVLAGLQRLQALAATASATGHHTARRLNATHGRAQIEIALHTRDFAAAAARLAPVLAAGDADQRPRSMAQLHLLSAIAQRGLGDTVAARTQLLAALRIGHRLGLLRSLRDLSPEVPALLGSLRDGDAIDPVLAFYVGRLQAMPFGTCQPAQPRAGDAPAPAETLSAREREVLGLLAQAMPNKKIAKVLDVSPDTVKFHLKNIYGKLGVSARDQAVARLRDLGG